MYIIILKTLMLNISVMLNIKFFISIQIRKKDFCDVKYQFFFIFIFFANLKEKEDFCDVQYQILGEIPTV